jgi:hypothetical protein
MIRTKALPHGPREHKLLKEERAPEGPDWTPVLSAAAGFNLTVRSHGAVLGRRSSHDHTHEHHGGNDE